MLPCNSICSHAMSQLHLATCLCHGKPGPGYANAYIGLSCNRLSPSSRDKENTTAEPNKAGIFPTKDCWWLFGRLHDHMMTSHSTLVLTQQHFITSAIRHDAVTSLGARSGPCLVRGRWSHECSNAPKSLHTVSSEIIIPLQSSGRQEPRTFAGSYRKDCG